MLADGQLTTDFGPEQAKQIAGALLSLAKQIENDADPEKQMLDQAVLFRAGAPIALNTNPKLLDAAFTEAQHNRALRRYMPHAKGIASKAVVGVPVVSNRRVQV